MEKRGRGQKQTPRKGKPNGFRRWGAVEKIDANGDEKCVR